MMIRVGWSRFLCLLAFLAGCATNTPGENAKNVCGNNILETGEACDGTALPPGSTSCEELGFAGGELICDGACTAVDTSNCLADSTDAADPTDPSEVTDPADPSADTDPTTNQVCGDGVLQEGETCDGDELGGANCESLGFDSGVLTCLETCMGFDTAGCAQNETECGNGVLEGAELCDGAQTGGVTCETVGYAGGTLGCAEDCGGYDTAECLTDTPCGNGIVESAEACDGHLLAGQSCANRGFVSGVLACSEDCASFDESGCWIDPPAVEEICGDGELVGYEACDGAETIENEDGSAISCGDFFGANLGVGELSCNNDCTLNVSDCSENICIAFSLYDNGLCDRCDLWGGSPDPDCTLCGVADGVCRDVFEGLLGVWTCQSLGTPDPDCVCGNGSVDGYEFCDGELFSGDWESAECSLLGDATGTLGCTEDCRLDVSTCYDGIVPVCGDAVIQGDEVCDTSNLADATCESLGLPSNGPLGCLADCSDYVPHGCYGTIPLGGVCGDPTLGTCVDASQCLAFLNGASYCVSNCNTEELGASCGEGFECVEYVEGAWCLEKTAERDSSCYENGRACLAAAGECRATQYDFETQSSSDYRCKPTCDPAGDLAQCGPQESCLLDPLGFGDIQEQNPSCTVDEDCQVGYSCTELANGTEQCFKRDGLCGSPVPPCLSADPAQWELCAADGANHCDSTQGHAYCADAIPAVLGAPPAFSVCVDTAGTGLCFSYCEAADGTELDCGVGAICERPAQVSHYLNAAQDAEGEYVACSTAADCMAYNSADDLPYECLQLSVGPRCARALKQCVALP